MATTKHLHLTTRRVAELADVTSDAIRVSISRNGHWRGLVPRKGKDGRWIWEARCVYQGLALIPAPLRPSPSDEFRDRVSEVAGADLYQAHKIASCLMSEDAPGATVRARFDNLPGDLRDFENLAEALTRRIGSVMQGEEEGTDDDWRRFNYYADKIESAVSKAVDVLRWRTAATVSAGANNPCGKVG